VGHEVDQLRQRSLTEEGKGAPISRRWKHATIDETRRDIVAGSLLFCQITRALPGRQRRQSGIADSYKRSRFNHVGGRLGSIRFTAPRLAPCRSTLSCPALASASGQSGRRAEGNC
jgi:hypothetical protein